MKLLKGNGQILEAYDVGPVIVRFKARPDGPPIKFNGYALLTETEARVRLEEIRATGLYEREV